MYTPKVYAAPDARTSHQLIEQFPFGLVVSAAGGSLLGSHLPFLLDRERGPQGTLLCHLAKANPQWRGLDGAEVLVVFGGPDAYVSPSWYANQVTVPTWNYAAVHAYGRARLVDAAELRAMVERLTHEHEQRIGSPWTLQRAEPIMEAELRGIVGFEIPVERLEGKLKLNQNRSREDREGVVRALAGSHDSRARGIAEMMAASLPTAIVAPAATATAEPAPGAGDLRYDPTARPPAERIAALYRAAGLIRPVDDLPRIAQMYADANVVWTAWAGQALVGALRGWTDGAFDGYVCDLAVDRAWQRHGIGRELLRLATEGRPQVQWVLRASAVAAHYYEHIGWKKIENGWWWARES